jgi:hypothetical protein
MFPVVHIFLSSELRMLGKKPFVCWAIVNNECNSKVVIGHGLASCVRFVVEAMGFSLHFRFQKELE